MIVNIGTFRVAAAGSVEEYVGGSTILVTEGDVGTLNLVTEGDVGTLTTVTEGT